MCQSFVILTLLSDVQHCHSGLLLLYFGRCPMGEICCAYRLWRKRTVIYRFVILSNYWRYVSRVTKTCCWRSHVIYWFDWMLKNTAFEDEWTICIIFWLSCLCSNWTRRRIIARRARRIWSVCLRQTDQRISQLLAVQCLPLTPGCYKHRRSVSMFCCSVYDERYIFLPCVCILQQWRRRFAIKLSTWQPFFSTPSYWSSFIPSDVVVECWCCGRHLHMTRPMKSIKLCQGH